jgi:hypothetical protein
MIEQGIYKELSNHDYHADKASLSRTSIKDFARSPYYYYAMHLNANRPERLATRDMTFGSAFHTLILEQHLFNDEYAIEPERVLLKDVGRAIYEAYKAECDELERTNKTVLSRDEFNTLMQMREALARDSRIKELIDGGEIEKSFFWQDPKSELMVKARPDILQHNMIVDLKTISDASPTSFQRAMIDGWYHVQGAMIRDAVRTLQNVDISNVINICVEKKYPFSIGIYIIDEEALNYGERLYKDVLLNMKSCIIENRFNDYDAQIIGLPKWIS